MTIKPSTDPDIQIRSIQEENADEGVNMKDHIILQGGANLLENVAGANTITADVQGTALTSYVTNMNFILIPISTNTTAVTLQLGSLTNPAVVDKEGNALVGGELLAGGAYNLVYDGANFIVMNPEKVFQAWTPVWSGDGGGGGYTTTTNDAEYLIDGDLVTIIFEADGSIVTSTTIYVAMSGLPAAVDAGSFQTGGGYYGGSFGITDQVSLYVVTASDQIRFYAQETLNTPVWATGAGAMIRGVIQYKRA